MTAPTTPPPPAGDPADRFKERMDAFGREAQAAGDRLSRDPGVVVAGTWFVRAIGLVLIVVGLWFTGLVTLGYDLPALDWELVWPIGLVLVGAFVIASGLTRRR